MPGNPDISFLPFPNSKDILFYDENWRQELRMKKGFQINIPIKFDLNDSN
jgi:hypothetical protein